MEKTNLPIASPWYAIKQKRQSGRGEALSAEGWEEVCGKGHGMLSCNSRQPTEFVSGTAGNKLAQRPKHFTFSCL